MSASGARCAFGDDGNGKNGGIQASSHVIQPLGQLWSLFET